MTTKEIFTVLQKTSTKQISYQAVHKTIKELLENEIITRTTNKKIELNTAWINNMEKMIQQLNQKNNPTNKIEESNGEKYTLTSFAEAGKLVIKLAHDLDNPKNKECFCIFRHSWPLFGMTKTDYELLEETVKRDKWFELIKGNTNLDKIFAKPLQDMGKLIIHGAKTTAPFDIVVKGDYVQQIFFPPQLIKKLDEIYEACKSLDDLSIVNLLKDFVVEKNNIIIKLVKDENLAQSIRGEALCETKDKTKTIRIC